MARYLWVALRCWSPSECPSSKNLRGVYQTLISGHKAFSYTCFVLSCAVKCLRLISNSLHSYHNPELILLPPFLLSWCLYDRYVATAPAIFLRSLQTVARPSAGNGASSQAYAAWDLSKEPPFGQEISPVLFEICHPYLSQFEALPTEFSLPNVQC